MIIGDGTKTTDSFVLGVVGLEFPGSGARIREQVLVAQGVHGPVFGFSQPVFDRFSVNRVPQNPFVLDFL